MTTSSTLAPGMLIANRFRLDRPLGQGGMGSVWAAWHITLNVEVAVKFIDPQYVSNRDAWSRFSQEAMAAAKIKSPHVVNVLDFGTDEQQRPYIAMELLQGEELASLLDRETFLPLPLVVNIVTQACKGLARAHAARVIHRDIKPDNIFLCEDDDGFHLKILDFGIAKVGNIGVSTHKTGTGQVLGTPLYMSPEQAYGNRSVDHRSDLYSLAVVAYRCLTGSVPFQSDGVGELIVAITTQPPQPPSRLRAGLPSGVDAWFMRALSKDPELRFRSAREMSDSLLVACGRAPSADSTAQFTALNLADLNTPIPGAVGDHSDVVPLVRRGNPSSPPSSRRQAVTLQGTTSSFLELQSAQTNRRRWLIAGAVVAALGLAAGAALYLSQPSADARALAASSLAPTASPPAPAASSATPALPQPTAVATAPVASGPVVSINSLPPELRPGVGKKALPGVKGVPGPGAPGPGAPAVTGVAPPTTATMPPPAAPAGTPKQATPPTKIDYGI